MPLDAPPIILVDWDERGRRVELSSHDLPEPPLQLGGETRRNVTRYAGTGDASAQILGLKYEDIDLQGKLEDQKGGPGHAQEAWDALESMWKAQHLIRLEYGPHVYWGLLDVTGEKHHAARIDYRLKFEILFDKNPDAREASTFETQPGPELEDVEELAGDPVESAEDAPDPVAEFAAELLTSLLAGQNAISEAVGLLDSTATWAEMGAEEATRTSRYLAQAASSLDTARDLLRSAEWADVAGTGPSEAQAAAWGLEVGAQTNAARAAVLRIWRRFEEVRDPSGIRTHVARSTDTLPKLAAQYYGDWTRWTKIADANDLDTATVEAGTELTIPRV